MRYNDIYSVIDGGSLFEFHLLRISAFSFLYVLKKCFWSFSW